MIPKHFYVLRRNRRFVVRAIWVQRVNQVDADRIYLLVADNHYSSEIKAVYLFMGDMSGSNSPDRLFADRIEVGDTLFWDYTGKYLRSPKKVIVD